MATESPRSLDVAETATLDMMALNNRIVSMRNTVKQARVRVVQKLVRQIKDLRNKKGKEDMLKKNQRRADRLVEEIHTIKHLKPDKISKFALGNSISFAEICKKDTTSIESRALTRLSENQVIQNEVVKFRSGHPDWKSLTAYLLMKQTGRRYKKKKNQTTTEKIDANIKARDTMSQTYLKQKLGREANVEKLKINRSLDANLRKKKKVFESESEKVSNQTKTVKEKIVKPNRTLVSSDRSTSESSEEDGAAESKEENGESSEQDVEHESSSDEGVGESKEEKGDSSDEDEENESSEDVESESSVDSDHDPAGDRLEAWGDSSSEEEGDEKKTEVPLCPNTSPLKGSSHAKNPSVQRRKEIPKKGGLKLEVLKQMFSSRTSDSESESNEMETIKKVSNPKLKSKILKEMLPDDEDSEEESDEDEESESEEHGESESESDDTTSDRKGKQLQGDNVAKKPAQQIKRDGVMVVKKINLQDLENDEDLKVKVSKRLDIPEILISKNKPVGKKTKDAFFANSDESDEEEELDDTSSQESSSDGEQSGEEEEDKKSSFESTFIGTLSHKKQLKRGSHSVRDHGTRGQGSFHQGQGDFRGRGGRGRSEFLRGKDSGFRGRGDRGRSDSGFQGRGGRGRSGSGFRGRGDRGRSDSGYRGRGRDISDSGFRGRGGRGRSGSGFRGRGDTGRSDSGYRGRGQDISDSGFRGRGGRGRSDSGFRGRGGRGRSDSGFRGRGGRGRSDSGFRGRGGRGRSDSGFRGRGGRGRSDSGFRGRGGRGRSDSGFRGRGDRSRGSSFRGRGQFDQHGFGDKSNFSRGKSSSFHGDRGRGKAESGGGILHPSWEASKRKKEQSTIHAFQGKKIKFDD